MSKTNYSKGEVKVEDAVCWYCEKMHTWSEDTCDVYNGKYICSECFQENFSYCNECGELYFCEELNEYIICKDCQ